MYIFKQIGVKQLYTVSFEEESFWGVSKKYLTIIICANLGNSHDTKQEVGHILYDARQNWQRVKLSISPTPIKKLGICTTLGKS